MFSQFLYGFFGIFSFLSFLRILFYGSYTKVLGIAEGGTVVGARSVDDLITTRRKYNFSDKIIWREKTYAPFLTVLNRRLQKYQVNDPEPKIMEDDYMPVIFTLNNNAGTAAVFELTDAQGDLFQPGDVLAVIAATGDPTTMTEYALVTSVGLDGSGPAGAGYKAIGVTRQYVGSATMNISTAASWRIVHMGLTYSEGDGIGLSVDQEVATVYNYTEIIKSAYEVTGTFNATDYYGPVDMQYKARKARLNFFRRLEYKLLFGIRGKKTVNGKPKRFTGGVLEHVPTANKLDFGGATLATTWNTKAESIFNVGSEEKMVFAGPGMMTLVDNAFSGSAGNYTKNEQLARNYLIRVMTLELTHGTLNFTREQALADLPRWTTNGFCLDLQYYQYMYMKGRDIQILKNVQENDKDTEKNALFAEIGLHRTFATSQFFLYNID